MSDECFKKTLCDGDLTNNYWIEGGDAATGIGGVCMLDNLTQEEVVYHIQHNHKARADLKRVTTDVELHQLADDTPPLPTGEFADALQSDINRNDKPESLPFYAIFRGQPPFAQ